MRIARGQLESGGEFRATLAAIDGFAAGATRDGAALGALPESATYRKKMDASFPAMGEPLDGPICRSLPTSPVRPYRAGGVRARLRSTGFLLEGPPFNALGF